MTRSLYKNDYISYDIYRKIKKLTPSESNLEPIITRNRNTTIIPSMVGKNFQIYNGKVFIKLTITTPEMVGFKLGEFIFTKRMGSYLHKKANAERIKKKKQKSLAKKTSKKKKK
jgi:small subunit ribosomal protein S19